MLGRTHIRSGGISLAHPVPNRVPVVAIFPAEFLDQPATGLTVAVRVNRQAGGNAGDQAQKDWTEAEEEEEEEN